MSQSKLLTKKDLVNFIACKNEFWLDAHFPEPRREPTLLEKHGREYGNELARLARTLPQFAAAEGVVIQFERTFQTGKATARSDIVATDLATNEIDIYEVKSGASVKEEYKFDLAFQCVVARAEGHTVRRAYLITVDSDYRLDGDLDATRLLRITDATEYVDGIADAISAQIDAAIEWLKMPEPELRLVDFCGSKLDCRSLKRKFPNIPEYNVGHVFTVNSKKLPALLELGILNVCDIPEGFKLTDIQAKLVAVQRKGEPVFEDDDKAFVREQLAGLGYPLTFLDYESFSYPIPKFRDTFPWQQMPFQYSLHIIDSEGAEPRHVHFLSRNDGRHPAEELVESLHRELDGRIESVVVWSEGFETKLNDDLGKMFPDYKPFLTELNAHVYDLRRIFSERRYMHPDFRGRSSIKNVLPVLCPDLTYEGMTIADGRAASVHWYHMATRRVSDAECQKIYDDLVAYCELDTLAMVRIYEFLRTL